MTVDLASLRALVSGFVQGVSFRAFVATRARELGVSGFVRNLPDGRVEVVAEGERKQLEKLVGYLAVGPRAASVEKVVTTWSDRTGNYPGFRIRY